MGMIAKNGNCEKNEKNAPRNSRQKRIKIDNKQMNVSR